MLTIAKGQAGRFILAKRGFIYEGKICETNALCRNDDELRLCLKRIVKQKGAGGGCALPGKGLV